MTELFNLNEFPAFLFVVAFVAIRETNELSPVWVNNPFMIGYRWIIMLRYVYLKWCLWGHLNYSCFVDVFIGSHKSLVRSIFYPTHILTTEKDINIKNLDLASERREIHILNFSSPVSIFNTVDSVKQFVRAFNANIHNTNI